MRPNYKYFCVNYEDIENYEKAKADNFKGYDCHHRLETHFSDGTPRPVSILVSELKALGMYYNRPASELIFLTRSEHHSIHQKCERNSFYGKRHSDETKKKASDAFKGENNPFYGKRHSDETRKKLSEANKGHPSWNKGKQMSEEQKKKISEVNKGKHWKPVDGKHVYY